MAQQSIRPLKHALHCIARGLLVLFLLLAGQCTVHAQETVSLYLRYYHQFQFAGYYAALEKGYYRDAGLDVSIIEGNGSNSHENVVLAQEARYGVSGSHLIVARAQGKMPVVLAVIFQHSPNVILAAAHSPTQGVHDLVGKRVMILDQSDELMTYLKKEGIPLSSLQRVPHSFNVMDLAEGKVDAFSAYVTNEPEYLDHIGFPYHVYSPRSVGVDFYGDNLFTSEAELRDHPERAEKFRAASLRGWQYAMEHPDEIIDLILSKYSRKNTRAHLQYEARQMVPLVQPVLIEIGYMNPGRWRHIADLYADLGMVPRNFALDGFLYDPALQGDLRWLYRLFVLGAVLLVGGVIVHMARIARERRDAQAALAASELRLRTLIEALPQQVWHADVHGRMAFVNQRVMDYFGLSHEAMAEGGIRVLLHPDDVPEALERWRNAFATGTQFQMDYRLRRHDGVYRWHLGLAWPMRDGEGRMLGWFGSSTDISDRKEAEEAMRQMNDQLELRVEERTNELRQAMQQIVESQKLASLGALVAGVAHELNTPIGNILMMASALSDRVKGFGEAAKAGNLTRRQLNDSLNDCSEASDLIVRSAHRASELIESFKRVSVDQASQRRRRFALAEVAHDVLNAIGPTLRRANIEAVVDIDESVEMDSYPGHLEQIIGNLVMNSVKHGFEGSEGGTIRISASERAGMIELVYQDDGRGIPEEVQHKVFEPFYTTKLGQGGSGLGMAIVHNLAHAIFKGRVRLESGTGLGVKLIFLWPAITPEGPGVLTEQV